jgi:hypothetical protein
MIVELTVTTCPVAPVAVSKTVSPIPNVPTVFEIPIFKYCDVLPVLPTTVTLA